MQGGKNHNQVCRSANWHKRISSLPNEVCHRLPLFLVWSLDYLTHQLGWVGVFQSPFMNHEHDFCFPVKQLIPLHCSVSSDAAWALGRLVFTEGDSPLQLSPFPAIYSEFLPGAYHKPKHSSSRAPAPCICQDTGNCRGLVWLFDSVPSLHGVGGWMMKPTHQPLGLLLRFQIIQQELLKEKTSWETQSPKDKVFPGSVLSRRTDAEETSHLWSKWDLYLLLLTAKSA